MECLKQIQARNRKPCLEVWELQKDPADLRRSPCPEHKPQSLVHSSVCPSCCPVPGLQTSLPTQPCPLAQRGCV